MTRPDNFDRALGLLRRHRYDEVADYLESGGVKNESRSRRRDS